MGLMDWFNSLLGRKETEDIKLEPDNVKEFEKNEDVEKDLVCEVKEAPKEEPKEDIVIPVKTVAKARAKAKKKSKKRKK